MNQHALTAPTSS